MTNSSDGKKYSDELTDLGTFFFCGRFQFGWPEFLLTSLASCAVDFDLSEFHCISATVIESNAGEFGWVELSRPEILDIPDVFLDPLRVRRSHWKRNGKIWIFFFWWPNARMDRQQIWQKNPECFLLPSLFPVGFVRVTVSFASIYVSSAVHACELNQKRLN